MIAKPVQAPNAHPTFRVSDERLIKVTASAAKRVSTLLQKQNRPNGVLRVDNVLWGGRVIQADADDDNTKAIKAFNDMVAADDRVEAVMLPISDGLTLCRKK